MSTLIGSCHTCGCPIGANARVHLRGAHCYCLDCVPANDAPRGVWEALLRLVGVALVGALAVGLLITPAIAGNARSDRTAITFQRDQWRRDYQNQQWAQYFNQMRRPATEAGSPQWAWQDRRRQQHEAAMNWRAQQENRSWALLDTAASGPSVVRRR